MKNFTRRDIQCQYTSFKCAFLPSVIIPNVILYGGLYFKSSVCLLLTSQNSCLPPFLFLDIFRVWKPAPGLGFTPILKI